MVELIHQKFFKILSSNECTNQKLANSLL